MMPPTFRRKLCYAGCLFVVVGMAANVLFDNSSDESLTTTATAPPSSPLTPPTSRSLHPPAAVAGALPASSSSMITGGGAVMTPLPPIPPPFPDVPSPTAVAAMISDGRGQPLQATSSSSSTVAVVTSDQGRSPPNRRIIMPSCTVPKEAVKETLSGEELEAAKRSIWDDPTLPYSHCYCNTIVAGGCALLFHRVSITYTGWDGQGAVAPVFTLSEWERLASNDDRVAAAVLQTVYNRLAAGIEECRGKQPGAKYVLLRTCVLDADLAVRPPTAAHPNEQIAYYPQQSSFMQVSYQRWLMYQQYHGIFEFQGVAWLAWALQCGSHEARRIHRNDPKIFSPNRRSNPFRLLTKERTLWIDEPTRVPMVEALSNLSLGYPDVLEMTRHSGFPYTIKETFINYAMWMMDPHATPAFWTAAKSWIKLVDAKVQVAYSSALKQTPLEAVGTMTDKEKDDADVAGSATTKWGTGTLPIARRRQVVLYDWRPRKDDKVRYRRRGIDPSDEADVVKAFRDAAIGDVLNVTLEGSHTGFLEQLALIRRHKYFFFGEGAFQLWMLFAPDNSTFVTTYENLHHEEGEVVNIFKYIITFTTNVWRILNKNIRLLVVSREYGKWPQNLSPLVRALSGARPFKRECLWLRPMDADWRDITPPSLGGPDFTFLDMPLAMTED